jgi:hypothetical protein
MLSRPVGHPRPIRAALSHARRCWFGAARGNQNVLKYRLVRCIIRAASKKPVSRIEAFFGLQRKLGDETRFNTLIKFGVEICLLLVHTTRLMADYWDSCITKSVENTIEESCESS